MGTKDETRRGRSPGGQDQRGRSAIDAGFERWLDKQLHRLYDPVLSEQLPDDIARLVEQFAPRPSPEDDGAAAPPSTARADADRGAEDRKPKE
jgi:hypothetical protein